MDASANHNFDSDLGGRANPARRHSSGRRATDWSRAFAATPIVRAEAVARARGLIAEENYPPIEVIDKIALLLAQNLAPGREIRSS
jgi:hypothetical protein